MSGETVLYTLAQAQKIVGISRHLVTFLINDRQIPTVSVGMARVLTQESLEQLKAAVAEYEGRLQAAGA